MKCREIVSYRQRLDHLFAKVSGFSDDPELLAQWANYLCVLLSGFLEVAVRDIYSSYAKGKAEPRIANFVSKRLESVNNPKMEKIFEVARWFSPEWESDLRSSLDDEHRDAVDSIIANRHLIAHGRSTGLTYARLCGWYRNAVEIVELLETQCEL